MFRPRHVPVCTLLLLVITGCSSPRSTSAKSGGVQIIEQPGILRVDINGEMFTEYHYQDANRPYYYPVIGPQNSRMTRDWPMASPPGEAHDHPHHRSLWYAHGEVNGVNFWTDVSPFGKIVHDKFTKIKSGRDVGVIMSTDNWIGPDGKIVCTDDRTMRIYDHPGMRLFDFDITIHASHGAVTLGDTKEGTMAIRMAETMKLLKPGQGHIVNSAGVRDGDTWGKPADWCDYYGPVDGKTVGIVIFDNPANPRHPTTWHVRDYGLFAANPFGLHDFEKKPAHSGDLKIPAGQSATFRYRFYIHEGDDKQAKVAEMYADYARDAQNKSK